MAIRTLTCCICGSYAGRYAQHWNRDTGFGICQSCAAIESKKLPSEEMTENYGQEGLNYGEVENWEHG